MAKAPTPCHGIREAEPAQQLPIGACRSCECWHVHTRAPAAEPRKPPAMQIVLGHLVCRERVPEYLR